ncbi:hypothetical protein B0J12DRAFT_127442 [Macrophomina phaseolina]|uniref:Uncharacterized protein n=1 Tax=Macrophomina phaseolina TaxID=35725 RepID=A0ABQ8G822_9PEZI|nr:hypothetical protein B0J12DRAFT_127442 [Macrophomina phaseolina]
MSWRLSAGGDVGCMICMSLGRPRLESVTRVAGVHTALAEGGRSLKYRPITSMSRRIPPRPLIIRIIGYSTARPRNSIPRHAQTCDTLLHCRISMSGCPAARTSWSVSIRTLATRRGPTEFGPSSASRRERLAAAAVPAGKEEDITPSAAPPRHTDTHHTPTIGNPSNQSESWLSNYPDPSRLPIQQVTSLQHSCIVPAKMG